MCDIDGSELYQREDDNLKRLNTASRSTMNKPHP